MTKGLHYADELMLVFDLFVSRLAQAREDVGLEKVTPVVEQDVVQQLEQRHFHVRRRPRSDHGINLFHAQIDRVRKECFER